LVAGSADSIPVDGDLAGETLVLLVVNFEALADEVLNNCGSVLTNLLLLLCLGK
jgi:hypothetical protein